MAKKYAVTALEHAPAVSVVSHEAQESINERGKKLLDTYIRRAKEAGIVSLKGVLVRCTPAPRSPLTLDRSYTQLIADVPQGVSTHEGEFICRLAANRDVDFIFLGRRGLNKCAPRRTLLRATDTIP